MRTSGSCVPSKSYATPVGFRFLFFDLFFFVLFCFFYFILMRRQAAGEPCDRPDCVSHSLSLKGINTFVVMRSLNYSRTPGVRATGIIEYITTSHSLVEDEAGR